MYFNHCLYMTEDIGVNLSEVDIVFCIVSTERDFIMISSASCISCLETKMKLEVYNLYPLSLNEFNELKSYNLHRYNVNCKCGNRVLWNQWKQKYSVKKRTNISASGGVSNNVSTSGEISNNISNQDSDSSI